MFSTFVWAEEGSFTRSFATQRFLFNSSCSFIPLLISQLTWGAPTLAVRTTSVKILIYSHCRLFCCHSSKADIFGWSAVPLGCRSSTRVSSRVGENSPSPYLYKTLCSGPQSCNVKVLSQIAAIGSCLHSPFLNLQLFPPLITFVATSLWSPS